MKLWYDKKSKDPNYFIQMGIRNGKKTTTKNVARIGRHSELLKITDDPLAYAKEQVKKYNEEYQIQNRMSLEIKVDFAEKIKAANAANSKSTLFNIGYFFLQQFYLPFRRPFQGQPGNRGPGCAGADRGTSDRRPPHLHLWFFLKLHSRQVSAHDPDHSGLSVHPDRMAAPAERTGP